MTRSEFINDLRARIWNLPVEEVTAAVTYYDNFIMNAGIENETAVLDAIGSPQMIAENITQEYNANLLSPSRDYSRTNPARNMRFAYGSNTAHNDANGTNSYSYGYNDSNRNTYNSANNNHYNSNDNHQYNNQGPRRLFKSEKDGMVFGVCSGLAEYFDIDPSLVRIIAVLIGFTGAGFFAYIAAAIILPDKSKL